MLPKCTPGRAWFLGKLRCLHARQLSAQYLYYKVFQAADLTVEGDSEEGGNECVICLDSLHYSPSGWKPVPSEDLEQSLKVEATGYFETPCKHRYH